MEYFGHEKLGVYKKSIKFVSWTQDLFDRLNSGSPVINQLERASISVPLNIAEGNGKFTSRDKCRYFDIARGSALESAACLDVMASKKMIDGSVAESGKVQLHSIVSMLFGLIRSNSDRVFEPTVDYEEDPDKGSEYLDDLDYDHD
ncbi:MAG: four helix bundle protein [Candidatus Marinimicrobia bacterium]|nr:four helix bundle protein [Candidatus Neomarinimicrobiota bacterium]